jgi:hypothetical protein
MTKNVFGYTIFLEMLNQREGKNLLVCNIFLEMVNQRKHQTPKLKHAVRAIATGRSNHQQRCCFVRHIRRIAALVEYGWYDEPRYSDSPGGFPSDDKVGDDQQDLLRCYRPPGQSDSSQRVDHLGFCAECESD